MAQADSLATLAQRLKGRGLTLVCYSGYTLAELEGLHDPSTAELVSLLDILIDGRFEAGQRATLPWRGSRNQKVHFLSPTYRHLEMFADQAHTELELIIGIDGFASSGIISSPPLKHLDGILKKG